MYLVGEKMTICNAQKKKLAPSSPEFITDYWSCQLSPFPEPPPPRCLKALSTAPPPHGVEIPTSAGSEQWAVGCRE